MGVQYKSKSQNQLDVHDFNTVIVMSIFLSHSRLKYIVNLTPYDRLIGHTLKGASTKNARSARLHILYNGVEKT